MTAGEDYCYVHITINYYLMKQKKLEIFDVLHEFVFDTIADANDKSLWRNLRRTSRRFDANRKPHDGSQEWNVRNFAIKFKLNKLLIQRDW